MRILDAIDRPLRSMRVSVTDRCNLRCAYCMPEEEYRWLPRSGLLTFEEIRRLASVFAGMGVERVRITGGEPLLRRDVELLIGMLRELPLQDLSLTTNGVLLAGRADSLHRAGLHRVTVSLDTLRPERFRSLSRRGDLQAVRRGIERAAAVPFRRLKLNMVVLRGFNDDEVVDMLEFGRDVGAEVRFIEYMDVGGATRWSPEQVVPRQEILARIQERCGIAEPLSGGAPAPAERHVLPDGTVFGIIASTTAPFCGSCNRSRLTADGIWYLCLYAARGIDLRSLLRSGASDENLAGAVRDAWRMRRDRGAEERLGEKRREAILPVERLREDPHLEMHTRGG